MKAGPKSMPELAEQEAREFVFQRAVERGEIVRCASGWRGAGRKRGRRAVFTTEQLVAALRSAPADSSMSAITDSVCAARGFSRPTFYRALRRARLTGAVPPKKSQATFHPKWTLDTFMAALWQEVGATDGATATTEERELLAEMSLTMVELATKERLGMSKASAIRYCHRAKAAGLWPAKNTADAKPEAAA